VRFIVRCLIALALGVAACSAQAAHTKAALLLSADSARPGDTILAGVRLQMDPGWHTYWRNSGASGMPTKIDWQLPAGVTAGPTSWPLPEKLPEPDLTTYVYNDEVVLVTPLKLSAELKPGLLDIKAKVSWLECASMCIPGRQEVQASLAIGSVFKPSKEAQLLKGWEKKAPKPAGTVGARAWWAEPPKGDTRPLVIGWKSLLPPANTDFTNADFFPFANENFEVLGPTQPLPAGDGLVYLSKDVRKYSGRWPKTISGVIVQGTGPQREGEKVVLQIQPSKTGTALSAAPGPSVAAPGGPAAAAFASPALPPLWKMLLYALIGGMILNIMPCVLPVIALKILGFVSQAREAPGLVRKLGLMYAFGVLMSFLALAGLVIGVQAAGHQAGWGMQFGSPGFLVILTVLVTLVALNLFGLFEVSLGGRVMGAAGALASRHGMAGAFFNGVLATVLATPCTAPFLGAALGFAFLQPAPIIILMFLTVGVGLALPYVVLSQQPAWLKFLPKPGPWMEKFRIAMGFPMLATALWLFSLLPIHYGDRAWWLGLFLVVLAFAAWIFGEFVQRGRRHRGVALATAIGVLAAGYAAILQGQMHWLTPAAPAVTANANQSEIQGLNSRPWSPEAVAKARAAGRPVLVDFTAKWCATCNLLVKPTLESAEVRKRLAQIDAVVLVGDYTLFPTNMTEELRRYGRAGVPLVLVYPKKPASPPIVLPEAFTPGMVVAALDRADL
jgi:thiol:disulfide interchange protein